MQDTGRAFDQGANHRSLSRYLLVLCLGGMFTLGTHGAWGATIPERVNSSLADLLNAGHFQSLPREREAKDVSTGWISLDAPVAYGKNCDPRALTTCWLPLDTPSITKGMALLRPQFGVPLAIRSPSLLAMNMARLSGAVKARSRDGWISLSSPPDPARICNAVSASGCLLPLVSPGTGFPPEESRAKKTKKRPIALGPKPPSKLAPLYKDTETPDYVRETPDSGVARTNGNVSLSAGATPTPEIAVPRSANTGNAVNRTSSRVGIMQAPPVMDRVVPPIVTPLSNPATDVQVIPSRY